MGLDDIWDEMLEGLGAIGDFFTSIPETITEFNPWGILGALLGFGFVFALRKQILSPFLGHMGQMGAIFWGGATYISAVIGGYIIFLHFANN